MSTTFSVPPCPGAVDGGQGLRCPWAQRLCGALLADARRRPTRIDLRASCSWARSAYRWHRIACRAGPSRCTGRRQPCRPVRSGERSVDSPRTHAGCPSMRTLSGGARPVNLSGGDVGAGTGRRRGILIALFVRSSSVRPVRAPGRDVRDRWESLRRECARAWASKRVRLLRSREQSIADGPSDPAAVPDPDCRDVTGDAGARSS